MIKNWKPFVERRSLEPGPQSPNQSCLWVSRRRNAEGCLDEKMSVLEAFLFTRIVLCLLHTLVFFYVVSDIFATIDFIVPSDGGPLEKWWTGLSLSILYLSFRLQMICFYCKYERLCFSYKLSNVLKTSVPFFGLLINDKTLIKSKVWHKSTVFGLELVFVFVFSIYISVLIYDMFRFAKTNWQRTELGWGLSLDADGIAFIEMFESLASLRSKAERFMLVLWTETCTS